MQLDCLTAGSSPSQRSLINTLCQIVSLLAPHSFPLSLDMDPLHVSVCALRPTLCSPPLSPSSCLVFSWPVCVSGVLPGAGVMHYRSKGLR